MQVVELAKSAGAATVIVEKRAATPRFWWRDALKAVIEWRITLVIVLLLSPVLLAIAMTVLVTTGRPVIRSSPP